MVSSKITMIIFFFATYFLLIQVHMVSGSKCLCDLRYTLYANNLWISDVGTKRPECEKWTSSTRQCTYLQQLAIDKVNWVYCPVGYYNNHYLQSATCDTPIPQGVYGLINYLGETRFAICDAGYVCPGNQTIRKCRAGYYCPKDRLGPDTLDLKLTREDPCPIGKYSSEGSTSCLTCPQGTYSQESSPACTACEAGRYGNGEGASQCNSCNAGYYSNAIGAIDSSTCRICPPGSYSANSGSTECLTCPQGRFAQNPGSTTCEPCKFGFYCPFGATNMEKLTKDWNSNSLEPAQGKIKCENGKYCFRHLIPRTIIYQSSNNLHESVVAASTDKTVVLQNANGIISTSQQSAVYVHPGLQIIVDCTDDSVQTPIYIGDDHFSTTILLEPSNNDGYSRLVFRNCLILSMNLVLGSNSVLILESSSISMDRVTVQSDENNPAYIILEDKSVIIGLSNPLPNNIHLIQNDVEVTSIVGCDPTPACDQGLFVFKNRNFVRNQEDALNYLSSFVPNTNSFTVPDGAKANNIFQKSTALFANLICGAFGGNIHPPSTYITRVLYCSDFLSKEERVKYLNLGLTVANAAVKASKFKPSMDITLLSSAYNAIASFLALMQRQTFERPAVIPVPAVSLDFLTQSDTDPKSLNKLISTLSKIHTDMETFNDNLQQRVQDLLVYTGTISATNQMSQSTLESFLQLNRNMKTNSEASRNIANDGLAMAKDEKKIIQKRLESVTTSSTAAISNIRTIKDRLPGVFQKAKKQQEEINRAQAIMTTVTSCLDLSSSIAGGVASGGGAIGAFAVVAGAVSGGLSQGQQIQDSWSALSEIQSMRADQTGMRESVVLFEKILKEIQDAKEVIDNYKANQNQDLSAFSMPVSSVTTLQDQFLRNLGEAGCGFGLNNNDLIQLCSEIEYCIRTSIPYLVESLQTVTKLLEVTMKAELLEYEVRQYDNVIKNWNDAVQVGSGLISDNIRYYAQAYGDVQQRMAYVLNLMHTSWSKIQMQSIIVINNALNGLEVICRAAAYKKPGYLAGNDEGYNRACQDDIDLKLDAIMERLGNFSVHIQDIWQNGVYIESIVPYTIDVTKLVNITEFWKKSIPAAEFMITPEVFLDLTNALSSVKNRDNVDVVDIRIFMVNHTTGNIIRPQGLATWTGYVDLIGSNIKVYKNAQYKYDLASWTRDMQPRFRFTTPVTKDNTKSDFTTKNKILDLGDGTKILNKLAWTSNIFAPTSLFGKYRIQLFDYVASKEDRIYLTIYTNCGDFGDVENTNLLIRSHSSRKSLRSVTMEKLLG